MEESDGSIRAGCASPKAARRENKRLGDVSGRRTSAERPSSLSNQVAKQASPTCSRDSIDSPHDSSPPSPDAPCQPPQPIHGAALPALGLCARLFRFFSLPSRSGLRAATNTRRPRPPRSTVRRCINAREPSWSRRHRPRVIFDDGHPPGRVGDGPTNAHP